MGSERLAKIASAICIDYSIGQRVFDYLEGKLPEEDTKEFVQHVGDGCDFCLQTIVRYHYEAVIAEQADQAEQPEGRNSATNH